MRVAPRTLVLRRASMPRTCPPCWTPRGWQCGRGTTARSRCTATWACPPRRVRPPTSTTRTQRLTRLWTRSRTQSRFSQRCERGWEARLDGWWGNELGRRGGDSGGCSGKELRVMCVCVWQRCVQQVFWHRACKYGSRFQGPLLTVCRHVSVGGVSGTELCTSYSWASGFSSRTVCVSNLSEH